MFVQHPTHPLPTVDAFPLPQALQNDAVSRFNRDLIGAQQQRPSMPCNMECPHHNKLPNAPRDFNMIIPAQIIYWQYRFHQCPVSASCPHVLNTKLANKHCLCTHSQRRFSQFGIGLLACNVSGCNRFELTAISAINMTAELSSSANVCGKCSAARCAAYISPTNNEVFCLAHRIFTLTVSVWHAVWLCGWRKVT